MTFDTSPTGALSPGATINLDLPNGTNGASLTSDTHVIDDTTGEFQGGCSETNGTALVVCDVNGANEIGAGDAVSVFLDGIVNPSTPSTSDTISVETSADNGAPVASNAYAIEAAQSVSGVAVSQAQSTANATSDYTVFFTASSSGAMAPGSGDSITLTFPGGFDVDALSSAGVLDGTEPVGLCSSSASTVTCPVADSPIRDGDVVEVRLNGVVNPPSTGTYVVGVQTSADNQTAVDGPVTIGPGQEVSDVTVSQTSPVTGAHSDYLVTFDLSSTGGLSAGDTVTLAFPQGTDLTSLTSTELGAPGNIAGSCADSTTTTATCSVSGSLTGGSQVGVSLDGVVNPPTAAANDTVGVETSVDDAGVVSSNGFAITADQEVSAVTASPAVPVAGAVSGYAISFDTSPTGEMAGGAGDTVTLSFPSGTGLDAMTSAEMTMNGEFVGNCPDSTSTTLSCVVEGAIAAGAEVSVALSGVINPDTAGADTVSVETSADNAGPVESPAFVLENPQPAVTAVGPTTGPAAGGNTVTVAGSDLQGASGVLFGTVPATDVEVNATGAQLTAIAPGTSGVLPSTVDVTVTTPSGTSARSSVDHYEYLPAPAISGVSPASGKAGGGARVTIAGTGFLGGQVEVAFGSGAATIATINAAGTQMTVVTPPSATIGAVSVSVTTNGGTAQKANAYTYERAITATTLQALPDTGSLSYGQSVTLTATVSPAPLGGTVRFTLGGVQLGSPEPVVGGQAQLPVVLAAGNRTVEAHYSGAPAFDASNASVRVQVARAGTAVTAQPVVESGASEAAMHVTLTSTVTGNGAGGLSITFKAGSTLLCSAKTAGDGGVTCVTTSASRLAALTKAGGYTASFSGSADYEPSSGTAGLGG